ncbi:MAG: DHH family phosphoesterase [Candidatus Thermoplasmatota archaeon]|nr:DHH family phosphoesterase [Candidatus Thermoplasmatota archaeon]
MPKNRLIVHHWDTDGICSAALLYDRHTKNITPKIGNYFLEEDEIKKIREEKFEEMYVVDMALHERSLMALADISPVKVFDHHLTKKIDGVEYVNPVLEGKDEEDCPSTSWVVGNILNRKDSILSFLGAVGDWEERLKTTRFYKKLQDFMEKTAITFEEMHTMVGLIDSNYKIGDKEEVERAVDNISKAGDVKAYVTNNEKWRKNRGTVNKEIEGALNSDGRKVDGILIKEMDCKYNIISTVARRLWDKKKYVIVINRGYFQNDCQLYIRGKDCLDLIKTAVKKGYVAGGKKNVMGAIVPGNECDKFVNEIVNILKRRKW